MNRKEFGKLVAALRQDLGWTQFQLAEYGRLDLATIGLIERGVKKHLEPEVLVKLAEALQLTTLERKEFLFGSTGIENEHLVREPRAGLSTDAANAEKSLAKMIDLMGRLRVPSFLEDVYMDVLAINPSGIRFFQVPPEVMGGAANVPGGFNSMRLIFGKDMLARPHFTNNWDYYALSSMWFFRQATLRYRAEPYFQYLIKTFRDPVEYPLFTRYWKMAASVEQDHDANFDRFSYNHDVFGPLDYATATTVGVTVFGELYLVQYLPTNDNTKVLFDRLYEENGAGILKLAQWPVKNMPK